MGLTGAILGDIAGSRVEFSKEQFLNTFDGYELFQKGCRFTDDTVLSLATAFALIEHEELEDYQLFDIFGVSYQIFGNRYPNAGYGGMFREWLHDPRRKPYNSFGNGSAMRASYIGEYAQTMSQLETMAKRSAMCTHSHPEGVKGAFAAAFGVFLGEWQACATQHDLVKEVCDTVGYAFPDKSLEELRPTCRYDVTCQGSIPLALRCFLESTSYESCIRNVLSMRCDRDTIACISGGIAESFYGSTGLDNDALLKSYLPNQLYHIWKDAMRRVNK